MYTDFVAKHFFVIYAREVGMTEPQNQGVTEPDFRLSPSLPIFSQVAKLLRCGRLAQLDIPGNGFEAKGALWAAVIPCLAVCRSRAGACSSSWWILHTWASGAIARTPEHAVDIAATGLARFFGGFVSRTSRVIAISAGTGWVYWQQKKTPGRKMHLSGRVFA